jgi:hypothetical protein
VALQLLAVVARYIPALVHLRKDMGEVRLAADMKADRVQALPSVGMETDRDRGAVEAVDPTATTHFAHQKQRMVPDDLRRHAGADSEINCSRVHADSNSQHAVVDTHTVEAWVRKHLASSPNFRTAPEKRNSFGGLPQGMLRVVAAVLSCHGSYIDTVPGEPPAVVEPPYFPCFRSFLLYLDDTHAAADMGPVVVKGAGDTDNRVVKHYPCSRGYSCAHPYSHLHCELLPGRVPARKIHPVSCLYPPPCTRVPNYGPEPRLVFWHGFLLMYWYPPQNELTWLLPWFRSIEKK